MKIAIISFGSLVFEQKNLKVFPWNEDGPVIKVEFSRISNNKRLTTVIDQINGGLVQASWAKSRFTNIEQALVNFEEREGIDRNRVSYINVTSGVFSTSCNRHMETARTIRDWAQEKDLDYVIFSGLGVKFRDVIDVPFSVENALNYLTELDTVEQINAIRYICNVSPNIITPFRTAFNQRFRLSFNEE